MFWYHNERMINYDTTRGGVTVSTEPGLKTHSRLIINSASTSDSGNYTCRASNTEADTIYVFVTKGEFHASSPFPPPHLPLLSSPFTFLYLDVSWSLFVPKFFFFLYFLQVIIQLRFNDRNPHRPDSNGCRFTVWFSR